MKSILLIVQHIPAFDTNAGDWRVYSLCRILAKRYNVFVLPYSFRWDDDTYENRLTGIGVKVVFPGRNNSRRFKRFILKNEIGTVIFRSFYTVSDFIKHLPLFKNVIIDTHEIKYLKQKRAHETAGLPRLNGYMKNAKNKEIRILEAADFLIAISETDKKTLNKELPNKNIMVIPTPVEIPKQGTVLRKYDERSNLVFFGFFGVGGSNDDSVEYFMKDIFPLIREKVPGIRLFLSGYDADYYKGTYKNLSTTGYVNDITEELSKYRVFVCPMRWGAGVKKKISDSMISGTPIVSTSIGLEGTGLEPDKDVLLADTPEDFAEKVIKLYQNRDLWEKLSSRCYNKAGKFYSEKAVVKKMEKLYKIIDEE